MVKRWHEPAGGGISKSPLPAVSLFTRVGRSLAADIHQPCKTQRAIPFERIVSIRKDKSPARG